MLLPVSRVTAGDSTSTLERRRFLGIAAVGILGVVVAKQIPTMAKLAPATAMPYEADAWKSTINSFITNVCPAPVADRACNIVRGCEVVSASSPTDFHTYFSAPVVLVGGSVNPISAGCTQFFELDRFPFYDRSNPPQRIKDLNAFEIRRVIYSTEVQYFGCVMSPCSERFSPNDRQKAIFQQTAWERYNTDPRDLDLKYVRYFNNGRRPHYGFGVASKSESGRFGKSKSDLLLSDSDV